MIKVNKPIIVEGKYDKITLENVIDGTIISINGFGIFKDKEKSLMIKTLALSKGIIVAADSDSAGNLIRSYLKKICGGENIINVYIPQLKGKEKRKTAESKEGFLGVEGMTPEIIEETFARFGVTTEKTLKKQKKLTKTDMFVFGLSGGENSRELRKSLLNYLNLPSGLSPNAMLDILNTLYSYDEFIKEAEKWRQELHKS